MNLNKNSKYGTGDILYYMFNFFIKLSALCHISKTIKKLDDTIHRIRNTFSAKRRVLFHGTNVMNYCMFEPIYKKIKQETNTDVFFCFSERKDGNVIDKSSLDSNKLGIPEDKTITLKQAKIRKWDAIFDSDFYTPWFPRNAIFIQIFHGVAAKALKHDDTLIHYGLHPNLNNYDICFFINKALHDMTKNKGLWKHRNSGEVVGMCCLDEMVRNNNHNAITKLKEKLIPKKYREKKVILYAPTWGKHCSLAKKGMEIIDALAKLDAFIIIKPHPLCFNDKISGTSETLNTLLAKKFTNNNYSLITSSPYEAMNISDMMISDFSSITFEYTLLRKPIFLFISNNLSETVADREQLKILRNCSFSLYENEPITEDSFRINNISEEKVKAMKMLENTYFANTGCATDVAFEILKKRSIIS